MHSSQEGHDAVVNTLIKEGKADVNKAEKDGFAALYVASFYGHDTVVNTLIKEGKAVVNKQKHVV